MFLATSNQVPNADQAPDQTHDGEIKKDVPYFRNILKVETDRLREMCENWDTKINDTIPEDIRDQILAVIGNSRLAMAKKGRFTQVKIVNSFVLQTYLSERPSLIQLFVHDVIIVHPKLFFTVRNTHR